MSLKGLTLKSLYFMYTAHETEHTSVVSSSLSVGRFSGFRTQCFRLTWSLIIVCCKTLPYQVQPSRRHSVGRSAVLERQLGRGQERRALGTSL